MFATARFSAWVSACGFENGNDMMKEKDVTIEYFVDQYREALKQHLEDYIENFDSYMRIV
jgi:hypothetical protein